MTQPVQSQKQASAQNNKAKPAAVNFPTVPVSTSFIQEIFNRMEICRKKKGMMNVQELIRVAVADYLIRNDC